MSKVVLGLVFVFTLALGFSLGAILGVEVVTIDGVLPDKTMFDFIVENVALLASISSILALLLAFGLFFTWKSQQKQILLIQQKKEILENLARLSAAFRSHIIFGAFEQSETELFYKKLFGLMLTSMESISVYYMMKPKVHNSNSTYADLALVKQNDFLDAVKDYNSFIGDYQARVSYGTVVFKDQKIGYLLKEESKIEIINQLFSDIQPDDTGVRYMELGKFGMLVSKHCDKAVDAIKQQLE
ncbi:hypothetical protein J0J26_21810 [Vibrio vulnificus]|uniref:hypothetical protein n=1 Tax=Vibrio vulnificus TaxID=672 RepID=UPI0019D4E7B9|nr:hypothetical protein [Vibrio vulnificus]MBN8091038.1 hypothetical protein [Vibrio vulnificus]MBN8119563.1 hypothetical protein [Vibrio vulnificus]